MSTLHNTTAHQWPAPPLQPASDREALEIYEALSPKDRMRVARLVALSNAPLAVAVAAVVAAKPEVLS